MKHAIAIAALLACGAAQASFTGQFAPGNWTQAPGTGSINVFDANSLSITSGNNNTNTASDTDVTIALPSAGTVSFSWDYSTSDPFGPFWDPFIALEPAINQLTDDNGAVGQSGSRSFSANAGDVIGFRIRTVDNSFGSATVSRPASARYCPVDIRLILSSLPTAMTAMKLENNETAAMTAEPMAMPFVSAFVVLPTASRSARICRARL